MLEVPFKDQEENFKTLLTPPYAIFVSVILGMSSLLVLYHLVVVYCGLPVISEEPSEVRVVADGPVVVDTGDTRAPPPSRSQEKL